MDLAILQGFLLSKAGHVFNQVPIRFHVLFSYIVGFVEFVVLFSFFYASIVISLYKNCQGVDLAILQGILLSKAGPCI